MSYAPRSGRIIRDVSYGAGGGFTLSLSLIQPRDL